MSENIFNSYCAHDAMANDDELMREYNALMQEGALTSEPPKPQSRMSKVADVMFEYYVNNLLANPMTQVKNAISTTIPVVSRVYETAVTAGLSQSMKLAGLGNGEITFKEALAEAHGIASGVVDAFRFVGLRIQKDNLGAANETLLNQMGLPGELAIQAKVERAKRAIKADNFDVDNEVLRRGIDVLGSVVNTPGAMLSATDIFFKVINYRAAVYKEAMRKALNGTDHSGQSTASTFEMYKAKALAQDDPDILAKAIADADERTYTGKPQGSWNEWMAMKGHKDIPGLRWIVPFRRTMVNVLNYGIARTPLALGQDATRQALRSSDPAVVQEAIGRMAAGTMSLVALGAIVGDRITGAVPRQKQARDLWEKNGNKEYALKIGDANLPLDTLGQYTAFFKAYADYSMIVSNLDTTGNEDADPTIMNLAGELLFATANAMADDHWIGNLSGVMTSIERSMRENDPAPIIREIGNMAGSAVPKPVEWTSNIQNPYKIDRVGPFDGFLSKVPGIVDSMPPVISLWGDPVRRDHFLDPQLASPITGKDPVAQELFDVNMFIPVAERSPKGVSMSKAEYTQYMIYSGKGVMGMPPLRDMLAKVIDMDIYKSLTHKEGKANLLRSIILDYREAARDYMLFNSEWGKKAQARAMIQATQKGETK